MIVTPSLQSQLLQIIKSDDRKVYCVCTLAHQPNVLVSLLSVQQGASKDDIADLLPLNLLPAATLYLRPENKEMASKIGLDLGIDKSYFFDYKSETWRQEGLETPLQIAKEDVFLDCLFVGISFDQSAQRLGSVSSLEKALKSGLLVLLHDHYNTLWSIAKNGSDFSVKKTSDDKEKENELKSEVCSWKKVLHCSLVHVED